MIDLKSRTDVLRLANLLGALSHALDLVEGQPAGHCVRCSWIGIQIGQYVGLTDAEISDLFYTILLKDLGCSSNAARICQLYLTDDRVFKRDVKTLNTASLTQAIRFIISHSGLKTGLTERFRTIINTSVNSNSIAREVIQTRCHQGADIARQMRFSESVARGIENLDEHWSGSGHPVGKSGDEIPLFSRIALLSQVVDVFHQTGGKSAAISEVLFRSGKWLDPELVQSFVMLARNEQFWTDLQSPDISEKVFSLEPATRVVVVDENYLDEIAVGFARVIDSKSPFTGDHSERVSLFTDMIAAERGFATDHRRWLRRAALLHDIGMLGISNLILDKAGDLDPDEWAEVHKHPINSAAILRQVPSFENAARIVEAHHERLDGTGYPHGLVASQIPEESQILATAVIFDALTAERAYRRAVPIREALSEMRDQVGKSISTENFAALQRAVAAMT